MNFSMWNMDWDAYDSDSTDDGGVPSSGNPIVDETVEAAEEVSVIKFCPASGITRMLGNEAMSIWVGSLDQMRSPEAGWSSITTIPTDTLVTAAGTYPLTSAANLATYSDLLSPEMSTVGHNFPTISGESITIGWTTPRVITRVMIFYSGTANFLGGSGTALASIVTATGAAFSGVTQRYYPFPNIGVAGNSLTRTPGDCVECMAYNLNASVKTVCLAMKSINFTNLHAIKIETIEEEPQLYFYIDATQRSKGDPSIIDPFVAEYDISVLTGNHNYTGRIQDVLCVPNGVFESDPAKALYSYMCSDSVGDGDPGNVKYNGLYVDEAAALADGWVIVYSYLFYTLNNGSLQAVGTGTKAGRWYRKLN